MVRFKQFEIAVLIVALLGALFSVGAVIAQTQSVDREAAREARRLERQVETLEKSYAELKLESEKRWAVIETQLGILKWLGGVIGASSVGLVIKQLMDLFAARKHGKE